MNLPSHLPPLPEGSAYIGRGNSFPVDGPFEGWVVDERATMGWIPGDYLGSDTNSHYAVKQTHRMADYATSVAGSPPEDAFLRHVGIPDSHPAAETLREKLLKEFANDPDLRPVEPEPVASTQEELPSAEMPWQKSEEFATPLPGQIEPLNGWTFKTPIADTDPNGIDQHAPGAKLDAGKVRAGLLLGFGDALLAVAEVMTYGAEKYSAHGWKHVPNGEERYLDASMRHLLKRGYEDLDPESKMKHLAHQAWNSLAELQLHIRPTSPITCPSSMQNPPSIQPKSESSS